MGLHQELRLVYKANGEVGRLTVDPEKEYCFTVSTTDLPTVLIYKTLDELSKEWEVYRPEHYWYVDDAGNPHEMENVGDALDNYHKEVGNYFKTYDEAAEAADRQVARRRLKGKLKAEYTNE